MKQKRTIILLLVLALLLTGCGGVEDLIDDSAVRPYAEELLQSFLDGDVEACKALVSTRVNASEVDGIFDVIAAEFEDLGEYTMTVTNWQFNTQNGLTTNAYRYQIEGEKGIYYLDVTVVEGEPGFAGFHVSGGEEAVPAVNPWGPVHYLFLAVGLAVLAFVIWMTVDCARRKMKRKWLWILLILLLQTVLTFTLTDGSWNVQFNIGIYLGITNLTTYASGGLAAQFYVPVGALVYFFRRKDLTSSEPAAAPGESNADDMVEEA